MSGEVTTKDLENTLPYLISDHLGQHSYMESEVREYPLSPREDPTKDLENVTR